MASTPHAVPLLVVLSILKKLLGILLTLSASMETEILGSSDLYIPISRVTPSSGAFALHVRNDTFLQYFRGEF